MRCQDDAPPQRDAGPAAVDVRFLGARGGGGAAVLYWLDERLEEGGVEEVEIGRVAAGGELPMKSFVGHRWVARAEAGAAELTRWTVEAGRSEYAIEWAPEAPEEEEGGEEL